MIIISRYDMLDWIVLRVVIICDLDFIIVFFLNFIINLVVVFVYMYIYVRGYLKFGDYVDFFF